MISKISKSNVCHQVKENGDKEFIRQTIKEHRIDEYYQKRMRPEAFYLLAMIDYLCRLNHLPVPAEYEQFRKMKLRKRIYPSSVIAMTNVTKTTRYMKKSLDDAIPEFLRHNIVEAEIENIV